MNPRTTVVLIVLVALLGGAAWWQLRSEQANPQIGNVRPLFEGFDPARIEAIRIDNLERDVQVVLRRSEGGQWGLVDPIEYPADGGVVKSLLELGIHNVAIPVEDVDPEKLGLAPPRVVLEFEQGGEAARRHRLELGVTDVDGRNVFVRVDGAVLRTLQNVDSTLKRDLDQWRSRSILALGAGQVIDIQRRGTVIDDGEPRDVGFAAERDPASSLWRARKPFVAALDPDFVQLFLLRITSLRVDAFVDDAPLTLAPYGLDEPDVVLELGTLRGERHELHFAQPDGRTWYCRLAGLRNVWRVDGPSMAILSAEAESLVDARILRLPREQVTGLTLERASGSLRVRRRGQIWEVSTDADGTWRRADTGRVEDLLAVLETETFAAPLFDAELPPQDVIASIRVETATGDRLGGELGPAANYQGTAGHLFRRFGDELVVLAGPTLLELAEIAATHLRTLSVVRLSEPELARIALQRDDLRREYVRAADGLWRPDGVQHEAKAFARLVDRLISVKAAELIDPPAAEFREEVRVEIADKGGEWTRYRLGTVEGVDGEVFESGGAWARLDPGRLEGLAALLAEDA